MCNSVATPESDELFSYFDKVEPNLRHLVKVDSVPRNYHITAFTKPMIPFIGKDDPLRIRSAMWKFVPERASMSAYEKYDTCNAKAEEIFERRTYKDYILPKRGLVVLKGFYEGQEQPDKTSQPFYIYPADKSLLTLGCVYSDWYDAETDKDVRTFSIITTDANPMMADIHNSKKRMPFILDGNKAEQWLDRNSKNQIESLFSSFDEKQMAAYKISKEVNSSKNHRNVPEILNPVIDSGLSQLSLF